MLNGFSCTYHNILKSLCNDPDKRTYTIEIKYLLYFSTKHFKIILCISKIKVIQIISNNWKKKCSVLFLSQSETNKNKMFYFSKLLVDNFPVNK